MERIWCPRFLLIQLITIAYICTTAGKTHYMDMAPQFNKKILLKKCTKK